MIDKITDHVFVSGASSVISDKGREELKECGITHVLTVSASAVPEVRRLEAVKYHFIFAMDMPQQDVLAGGLLEEALAFIQSAIDAGGKVLVHCEMGMSRSVTVVAAHLMRVRQWSAEKAVVFIQMRRPIAYPSESFCQQLEVFHACEWRADERALRGSDEYRRWCLVSGNAPQSGSDPKAAVFVKDLDQPAEEGEEKGNKFRCGKCRHPLFFASHLVKHKRQDGSDCRMEYVIEPMKWMQMDDYQGKIACPSCGDKLGSYSWGGRACGGREGEKCFEQVTPWVHLHRSKVDEVRPAGVALRGLGREAESVGAAPVAVPTVAVE